MPPKLAFFSGGTALRDLSKLMATRSILSYHLISMFDSGGSTAELRRVFAMPAIGDLRNRLLALADPATSAEIISFCNYRFAKNAPPSELASTLNYLANFSSPHWRKMPKIAAQHLWLALHYFLRYKPDKFNLAGACMGNLMLAGVYLRRNRDLIPALALFERILNVRGVVLPITTASAHLAAKLRNGTYIVGQHRFDSLPAPVEKIFLSVHESEEKFDDDQNAPQRCRPAILPEAVECLQTADLICYPIGSFFSSILANLLLNGTGQAVCKSKAKKIFIPNTGHDYELGQISIASQARLILECLTEDAPECNSGSFLQYVLIDSANGVYPGGINNQIFRELENMGIQIIDRPLIKDPQKQKHDPELLLSALLGINA